MSEENTIIQLDGRSWLEVDAKRNLILVAKHPKAQNYVRVIAGNGTDAAFALGIAIDALQAPVAEDTSDLDVAVAATTVDGKKPSVTAVGKALGRKVSAAERDEAFERLNPQ